MASRRWQLAVLLLSGCLAVHGYSMQFGRMHSLSVPIYEAEIFLNTSVDFYDLIYSQKANLSFNINLILIIDESDVEGRGCATILAGGIGSNFTTLRLMYTQSEDAKVTVLIYGLPRDLPMVSVVWQIAANQGR